MKLARTMRTPLETMLNTPPFLSEAWEKRRNVLKKREDEKRRLGQERREKRAKERLRAHVALLKEQSRAKV